MVSVVPHCKCGFLAFIDNADSSKNMVVNSLAGESVTVGRTAAMGQGNHHYFLDYTDTGIGFIAWHDESGLSLGMMSLAAVGFTKRAVSNSIARSWNSSAGSSLDAFERSPGHCVSIRSRETQAPRDAHAMGTGKSPDRCNLPQESSRRGQSGRPLYEASPEPGESASVI